LILDIEADVVEEHATLADFLWTRRDAAVRSPNYTLEGLAELDERVEANLDGLRLAGDVGREVCVALLSAPEAEAGAVFAAAAVAVDQGDLPGIASVLDVGGAIPGVARGIVSALGWVSLEEVCRLLPGLLDETCPPELNYLGIAACAVHRHDPGVRLGYAVVSADARLRARALRAVGELARGDLLPELRQALHDADEGCRFAAAWSAAILGEPASLGALQSCAAQGGAFAARAGDVAMRRMDPHAASTWLRSLMTGPSLVNVAIACAAALGDPAFVPWLIERAEEPSCARRAGLAFATVTGMDLREQKLARRPPEDAPPSDDEDDEEVADDPDEGLPWPDAAAVRRAWEAMAPRFERGMRHVAGRPMSSAWLEEVRCLGRQPARAAAALELSVRDPTKPLFEVRAPGFQQQRALGGSRGGGRR
jgi:uncharacterized protein (TIGR02270 family)